MTEIEQLLVGLGVVGVGLTLKVTRDGIREIERIQGVITFTRDESLRYAKEQEEQETLAGDLTVEVGSLKEEVSVLEQRTTSMRTLVAQKLAEREKARQVAQAKAGLG